MKGGSVGWNSRNGKWRRINSLQRDNRQKRLSNNYGDAEAEILNIIEKVETVPHNNKKRIEKNGLAQDNL